MQLRMPWSRLSRKLANEMSISTCTQLITYMVLLSPSVQAYWSCNSPEALQSGGSSVTSTCGSLCLHALSFSPSYPCIRTSPKCYLLWEAFPIPAKAEVEMAVLNQKHTNKWTKTLKSPNWICTLSQKMWYDVWRNVWQFFPSLNNTSQWPGEFF